MFASLPFAHKFEKTPRAYGFGPSSELSIGLTLGAAGAIVDFRETDVITLYLEKGSPVTADILEDVARLVIAHRVVYLQDRGSGIFGLAADRLGADGPTHGRLQVDPLPVGVVPPALVDDEEVYSGRAEIAAHLEHLELFLKEWSKFQSDACYCDARGEAE
jgi:hypothetical protein